MSPKQILIRALVLGFVVLSAACQAAPATPVDRETERYAVYSAVITEAGGQPVLSDRVGGISWKDSDYDRVHAEIEQVDPLIWDSLRVANQQSEVLEARFDPDLGAVSLANWADLGILFSKNKAADAWEIFHQKYPDKCLMGASNIGFSDKLDKAILYVSLSCDVDSGRGEIVYLARKNGKWTVQGKTTLWGS